MSGSEKNTKKWPTEWASAPKAKRPPADAERLKKEASEIHLKIQDLIGKNPEKAAKLIELWMQGNPARTSKK